MHYVAAKLTHQEETNLDMHFEDLLKKKKKKKRNSSGLAKLFLSLIKHHAMKTFAGVGPPIIRGRFRRKESWPRYTFEIRKGDY